MTMFHGTQNKTFYKKIAPYMKNCVSRSKILQFFSQRTINFFFHLNVNYLDNS